VREARIVSAQSSDTLIKNGDMDDPNINEKLRKINLDPDKARILADLLREGKLQVPASVIAIENAALKYIQEHPTASTLDGTGTPSPRGGDYDGVR